MVISKGLRQAYDMQDFAYEAAMAIREKLKPKQVTHVTQDSATLTLTAPDKDTAAMIGTLGKVWRDAQEQIRIHRGKPLPGSLTHERVKRPKAKLGKLDVLSVLADVPAPGEASQSGETSSASGEASNQSS